MPYISKELRQLLLGGAKPKAPGELNYVICNLVKDYMALYGTSYTTLNALIGVLECAKLEIYRRVVAKYEEEKIAANGDIF